MLNSPSRDAKLRSQPAPASSRAPNGTRDHPGRHRSNWRDHLCEMDYSRSAWALRAVGPERPVCEYRIEGFKCSPACSLRMKEQHPSHIPALRSNRPYARAVCQLVDAVARSLPHPSAQTVLGLRKPPGRGAAHRPRRRYRPVRRNSPVRHAGLPESAAAGTAYRPSTQTSSSWPWVGAYRWRAVAQWSCLTRFFRQSRCGTVSDGRVGRFALDAQRLVNLPNRLRFIGALQMVHDGALQVPRPVNFAIPTSIPFEGNPGTTPRRTAVPRDNSPAAESSTGGVTKDVQSGSTPPRN